MNACKKHKSLALQAARESLVLLKNEDDLLPLRKDLKAIAVIGPNGDNLDALLGNYHGQPSKYVTPLEGVRRMVSFETEVLFTAGCGLADVSEDGFAEALRLAVNADVIVFVGGISPALEGEESIVAEIQGGGDRTSIELPEIRNDSSEGLHATGKPVVLVLLSGSCLSVNWAREHLPAILQAWYPGQEGGTAVAEALFGDYNPGGRLPITFYRSLEALPSFTDYRMEGRTYRFMRHEPLYPFGFGLSYTKFLYENLILSKGPSRTMHVSAEVTNIGTVAGDEVAQLYVTDVEASVRVPKIELKGFRRVHLLPGEKKRISFTLKPCQFSLVNAEYRRVVEPGLFQVFVGGAQPGCETSASSNILSDYWEITEEITEFD